MVNELDILSTNTDLPRSDVIEMMLRDTLDDGEKLDTIFGEEEEEGDGEEEEGHDEED